METSVWDLFQRGGPVMWPILLCSIAAVSIGIERLIALTRTDTEPGLLLTQVSQTIENRQLASAQRLCDQAGSPLARILKAGIRRYGRPREEIREAMEEQGAREAAQLQRSVPMLGTIAHIAPLLGLLGTVTGLVRCFQSIQEKASSIHPVNPGDLAGGIWEALLTTVFGLLVAIPAYALYNALVYKTNTLVHQWESTATELADSLAVGAETDFLPKVPDAV